MQDPLKAFISYSHRDAHALERLQKHLAMLHRDKLLSEWFDQKILTGGEVDAEISAHLAECQLFIALVSPDFLASPYCYETEMQTAIERHEAGSLVIVPVIIEPCDWKSSPLQRFKALPKDGKPVSEWVNENTAYLDIVTEFRRLIEKLNEDEGASEPMKKAVSPARSRQYRVKRDFDEVDRSEFRDAAFQEIKEYFRAAIAEIKTVENIKAVFKSLGDSGFTCTIVNRALHRGAAHITVYARSGDAGFGDISYAFAENAEPGTANGTFEIASDEYDLFLKVGFSGRHSDEQRLTTHGAAETLWDEFLEHAGIDYE